ncbi:unnamed protein product [Malus baccata var. baccata]|uniref:Uncharacterized protein n=1 Tax=Malus domestica TaxID=3750 RepID=A0A498JU33_MALDO|nr:hypothetical protein DVH24_010772 [Malus domestica]
MMILIPARPAISSFSCGREMERSYRQTKVQQNKQRYVHFLSLPPRQKRPIEFRRHEIRKLVPDNWFLEIQKNLIRLGNPDRIVFDESRELP